MSSLGDKAEDFCNWFFGVAGMAPYDNETFIRMGAGVFQTFFQGGPQSDPLGPNIGDQPPDQESIHKGVGYYKKECYKYF